LDDGSATAGSVADASSRLGRGQAQVSGRVLVITLMLSLWIALGSLVLAIAEGLGPHPTRRLAIGLILVAMVAAALWQRDRVCGALRARPWLVVVVAAAQLVAVVTDGVIGGPYLAVTITSIGLASVVANATTVWACVMVFDVGYAVAILVERTPGALSRSGDLAGVLGAMLGYPFAALVVLGLAGLYTRFVADADANLDAIRRGAPTLTPALGHAVLLGSGRPPRLLPAPSPLAELSQAEARVVEGLAKGIRPKQLAHAWGVSLPTIRKHIRLAKRKTGALTLPELAAMTAWPDWPGSSSSDT
jgi:DNA-binding CsgD family transcriptional regulator